jgi:hypothetical protein
MNLRTTSYFDRKVLLQRPYVTLELCANFLTRQTHAKFKMTVAYVIGVNLES